MGTIMRPTLEDTRRDHMSQVTVERVTHDRWDDAVAVSNGTIELLAPTTIGPRITEFGFEGGRNEFHLFESVRDEWPLLGGHRLWHAPEDRERTYTPDLEPVEFTLREDGVRLEKSPGEDNVGKAITVRMAETDASVEVTHELTNAGQWPVEFAPWSLTVMKAHGTAVVPFTPQADPESLLPDRSIQLWPYANLADDRLSFGEEHLYLEQDPNGDGETKIGTAAGDGWLAYLNDGHAFRKDFAHDPEATYPDLGSDTEVYTDDYVTELESLAPIQTVEPGETVTHVEIWTLEDGIEDLDATAAIEPDSV